MPDPQATWTDINYGNWIDRHLPQQMRPYARLMRLDRPIGTWLLVWPCWWSVALAAKTFPNLWLMTLFMIGAIIMRGAGCVINDIYDHNLDKKVERTRMRPLASGEIQIWQGICFLIILLFIGFGILLLFNSATIKIGAWSLILVFSYPLMKRLTWWPQLFLGLTFNWGALLGWTAVNHYLGFSAVCLYAAGIAWTLGYDTIYAYQDIKDDALIGIKSTARLFEKNGKAWVRSFYITTIILLTLTGGLSNEGISFYIVMLCLIAISVAQIEGWDVDNPASCLTHFRNNSYFGLIVFTGIILGKWF